MVVLLVFVLVALALIAAPVLLALPVATQLVSAAIGVALLIVSAIAATVTRLYRKASADEALVRTGMGGPVVVLDGGAIVAPVVHRVVPVYLRSMKLEVERQGPDALITKDNLRVDIKAEFYIRVQPNVEDILNAARSLGEKSVDEGTVGQLVFEKLVSALRSVAATKDLSELHTKRDEFASAVHEIVRADLTANGLTLESVTISRLDQTDTKLLNDDNVFDAQGKKKIAAVTQEARVERNTIERSAERAISGTDVETRMKVLELDRQRVEAETGQAAQVAIIRAAKEREQRQFVIEQEEQVARRELEKDEAIARRQVERDEAIALQEVKKAQAVAEAEREQAIAIATKEAAQARAEAERLAAEAERERAAQAVQLVQVEATAERERTRSIIAAQAGAEQERVQQQTVADIAAYTRQKDAEAEAAARVKRAEADQEAASREAEAMIRRAEAAKASRSLEAEGLRAEQMVPVEVERARVDVERARMEVERQALENKQTYSEAALEFEKAKMEIEAKRDIQIAAANAMGSILTSAKMTIWGDPNTAASMAERFFKGMSAGYFVDGLMTSTPDGAKAAAGQLIDGAGNGLAGLLQRLTGQQVDEATARRLVEQFQALTAAGAGGNGNGSGDGDSTPPTATPPVSPSPADTASVSASPAAPPPPAPAAPSPAPESSVRGATTPRSGNRRNGQ